ncbi:MAG: Zinc transport protein ZntB [Microgenomates bacterium OLB23]|nr:MAG: Zinc transport protein ZntB [Microgenomates bacterium OLB23]
MRFVELEGTLNDFRPALVRTNNILESLTSGRHLTFRENDRDLIEDIVLSNRQLIEQTDDSIRTIKNVREAYTTIMTNNLNQVIKLLTSLTVIFTIPTMIASLYGMNVSLPLGDHPLAFLFVIGIIATVTGITFYAFIQKDFF